MNLAKGRNGKIGRHIPGQGLQAKVVGASGPGYSRNLFLTEDQIVADQHYFKAKDQQARSMGRARIERAKRKQLARMQQRRQQSMGVAAYQKLSQVNPMNDKLKLHFARQITMGQSQKVAGQLYHTPSPSGATSGYHAKPRPPADFSNSGANMHLVPGVAERGSVVWHSDNRMHMIKGNPLTRDGAYGPKVTDYDRFVNGVDVNQSIVEGANMTIAGNTMLGRYEGKSRAYKGYGFPQGASGGFGSMGDDIDFDYFDDVPSTDEIDFSYFDDPTVDSSIDYNEIDPLDEADYNTLDEATPESPGFFDKVWTATEVQASKALPALLQQQMLQTLASGGKVGTTKDGTIVITQPGKPASVLAKPTMSAVPPMVIYASVGLVALGLLMFFMKSRRTVAA